jgi:hypothetical protein
VTSRAAWPMVGRVLEPAVPADDTAVVEEMERRGGGLGVEVVAARGRERLAVAGGGREGGRKREKSRNLDVVPS